MMQERARRGRGRLRCKRESNEGSDTKEETIKGKGEVEGVWESYKASF